MKVGVPRNAAQSRGTGQWKAMEGTHYSFDTFPAQQEAAKHPGDAGLREGLVLEC